MRRQSVEAGRDEVLVADNVLFRIRKTQRY